MTFTQYIVFTVVNDNAEYFPKVAVDAYPTVVIGIKFAPTFMDWGDQSLVPNIGEYDRTKDDVKELHYSQLELVVCIFYNFIEDTMNTTGRVGLEALYFVL